MIPTPPNVSMYYHKHIIIRKQIYGNLISSIIHLIPYLHVSVTQPCFKDVFNKMIKYLQKKELMHHKCDVSFCGSVEKQAFLIHSYDPHNAPSAFTIHSETVRPSLVSMSGWNDLFWNWTYSGFFGQSNSNCCVSQVCLYVLIFDGENRFHANICNKSCTNTQTSVQVKMLLGSLEMERAGFLES